jgi:hypothetical protein
MLQSLLIQPKLLLPNSDVRAARLEPPLPLLLRSSSIPVGATVKTKPDPADSAQVSTGALAPFTSAVVAPLETAVTVSRSCDDRLGLDFGLVVSEAGIPGKVSSGIAKCGGGLSDITTGNLPSANVVCQSTSCQLCLICPAAYHR